MGLSAKEIQDIESAHPLGLSSKQILEVLEARGEHLTEATLRKYVQLGLLPRSRRVGEKGKHRGSRGIYPVEVVRRIDELRRAMRNGETLGTLAGASQAVRSKLVSARVAVSEVIEAAEKDLAGRSLGRGDRASMRSAFAGLCRDVRGWLRDMERWTALLQESEQPTTANGAPRSARTRNAARRSRPPGGV